MTSGRSSANARPRRGRLSCVRLSFSTILDPCADNDFFLFPTLSSSSTPSIFDSRLFYPYLPWGHPPPPTSSPYPYPSVSATWPESVRSLAATFMKTPTRITVGSDELTANARVSQSVEVFNTSRDKDPRLLTLLKSHSTEYTANGKKNVPLRILVFALYKKEATRLEQTIRRAGYKVGGLHGDMGQAERMRALEGFVSGDVGVLVATGELSSFIFAHVGQRKGG
jgi:hypothetical protein